jgi:MarR family transcriptional regulator, lower aerobic nicotinate degradation pathway regulator
LSVVTKKGDQRKTTPKSKSKTSGDVMDLWGRPGFLVRRLHQLSVAIFFDEMSGLGLTPVQLGALIVASRAPDIEQSALGEALGIDRVNTGDVVSRLVRGKLLIRTQSPVDRRYKLIRTSVAGEALLKKSQRRMAKVQERFLAPLNEDEQATFMQLVKVLIAGINDQGRTPFDLKSWPSGADGHKRKAQRTRSA